MPASRIVSLLTLAGLAVAALAAGRATFDAHLALHTYGPPWRHAAEGDARRYGAGWEARRRGHESEQSIVTPPAHGPAECP